MSDFQISRKTGESAAAETTVVIEGKMTIENAAGIKSGLMEAFAQCDGLHLDLAEVSEIDLTGLQLICAAHISSIRLGKRFIVNTAANESLKSVVHDAGFVRHIGCSVDISRTCVWTGGDDKWER